MKKETPLNWTALLHAELAGAYAATEGLLKLVEDSQLGWKPSDENNWMTMGQLLHHITEACGMCCACFVKDDWKMPDGTDLRDVPPEQMMAPADGMPAVSSVAQARELLAADKATALQMIETAGEERLASEQCEAPWAPGMPMALGHQLLHMVGHLGNHRAQLFYYLKLLGVPVNTGHLYGAPTG